VSPACHILIYHQCSSHRHSIDPPGPFFGRLSAKFESVGCLGPRSVHAEESLSPWHKILGDLQQQVLELLETPNRTMLPQSFKCTSALPGILGWGREEVGPGGRGGCLHPLQSCIRKLSTRPSCRGAHELPYEVLELVAAEEHGEEFAGVHEVDIQTLYPMVIVPPPQVGVSQHLRCNHINVVPEKLEGGVGGGGWEGGGCPDMGRHSGPVSNLTLTHICGFVTYMSPFVRVKLAMKPPWRSKVWVNAGDHFCHEAQKHYSLREASQPSPPPPPSGSRQ